MKKLMIAAAAAAMIGGAYAEPVCGEDDTPKKCYSVYKYSFTGKTTAGIAGVDVLGNLCGEDDVDGCAIRVPATLKIAGWVAYCFCDCQNTIGSDTFDEAAFWATKPYKADIADGKVAYDFVNVIGKKGTQAEAAGAFTGTLTFAPAASWDLSSGLIFAGLGKYTAKNNTYSVSGNFAGSPAASWYIKGKDCEQTHVWDCVTMTVNCDDTPNTVAYGKWSVKYSAADSKNYMKGKRPATPSYATVQAL
jgi:hypothetical protein